MIWCNVYLIQLIDAQADLEMVENELRDDQRALADLEEQERIDDNYHEEKVSLVLSNYESCRDLLARFSFQVAILKAALQEKIRALEKIEDDDKISQEKRKSEWDEKEVRLCLAYFARFGNQGCTSFQKQHKEKLESQQKMLKELRQDFERLTGEVCVPVCLRLEGLVLKELF